MNRRSALVLIASSLPLAGCLTPPLRNAGLDASARIPYALSTGDRLRIIVFGQDNLSNIYAVDGTGRITMPLIGPVPVIGLTTEAAAQAIAGRLRAGYIREPKVTVEVDTYRPFFILGEVTTPGQYPFAAGMTVQRAVAIAGGFTPRGAKTYAEITRPTAQGPVVGTVPIDYPVRPGDTIMIKERWF